MSVGDYIRTKDGVIAKITDIIEDFSIDCDRDVFGLNNLAMMEIPYVFKDEYIIKSSQNIIDLIKENDFVKIEYFSNRYEKRVTRWFEVDYVLNGDFCFENGYCRLNILNGKWARQDELLTPIIKSIVTKEQFESMEYRIGD